MAKPNRQNFHVQPNQVHTTLAAALRQWLPGKSWEEVRRLIQARRVCICGNICQDPARRLRLQDVVALLEEPAAPPPDLADVRLEYVDSQVVVVEKPARMTSVRHVDEKPVRSGKRANPQPTLEEVLPKLLVKRRPPPPEKRGKERGKGQKGRGADRPAPVPQHALPRIWPVHRIDRDTSGLMLFARSPGAYTHLSQQFREHTIHRRYLAIVHGIVEAQTIESYLVRDRGDGFRGSTTLHDTGKRAVTHVRPVEHLGDYTLIECRLETGRTHQIRIHLSELGHPLCGDPIYLQPLFKPKVVDRSEAPRLALHAAEIGFVHPSREEELRFTSPLPEDLQQLLDHLRRQRSS